MNEAAQIAAMAAELRAEGYEVKQNVTAGSLDLAAFVGLGPFLIDIYATRPGRIEPRQVETLLVEIANRQRRPNPALAQLVAQPPLPSEEAAVERFKRLGEAVAQDPTIALEIRFLDVSADQAAARQLNQARITRADVNAAIRQDYSLWCSIADQPAMVRAAVLARLWSRALRMTAWRYPGRRRRELKYADLRTIQKDLYDYRILSLPPARYQKAHRAIMAISEGGTVSCEALLSLEGELKALWLWAADRLELEPEAPLAPATSVLFDEIRQEIKERVPADRRETAETSLALLKLFEGHKSFPALISQLHREIDLRTLSDVTFDQLMARLSEEL